MFLASPTIISVKFHRNFNKCSPEFTGFHRMFTKMSSYSRLNIELEHLERGLTTTRPSLKLVQGSIAKKKAVPAFLRLAQRVPASPARDLFKGTYLRVPRKGV